MTEFKLQKVSVGKILTNFRVTDANGREVFGSINLRNADADDLLKHWKGASVDAASAKPNMAAAMLNAAKRRPKLNKKAAILRGC
jgi:hypothetical protein